VDDPRNFWNSTNFVAQPTKDFRVSARADILLENWDGGSYILRSRSGRIQVRSDTNTEITSETEDVQITATQKDIDLTANVDVNHNAVTHKFETGKVIVSDTTQATPGGAGSVHLAGGIYGEGSCVFRNGIDVSSAGVFVNDTSGVHALLGSSTKAGTFSGVTNTVFLCDGTYAVNALIGAINANSTAGFSVNAVPGITDTDNGISGGIVIDGTGLPGGDEFDARVVELIGMYA
jgi:hypothetical protein